MSLDQSELQTPLPQTAGHWSAIHSVKVEIAYALGVPPYSDAAKFVAGPSAQNPTGKPGGQIQFVSTASGGSDNCRGDSPRNSRPSSDF